MQGDQDKLDALVMMNTRLVALVSNHDSVTADPDALAKAAEVYRDLLSSVSQALAACGICGVLASLCGVHVCVCVERGGGGGSRHH